MESGLPLAILMCLGLHWSVTIGVYFSLFRALGRAAV